MKPSLLNGNLILEGAALKDLLLLQILAPTFEFSPFVTACFNLDSLFTERQKLNEDLI